eukprot:875870-Pleurochrysis_carterae.AAC.1
MKQESKEALVRDYSNRIVSLLATAMRPTASLKLRKLQHTHALLMYPSMYDGVQMFKELKRSSRTCTTRTTRTSTSERSSACATTSCRTTATARTSRTRSTR